MKDSNIKCSTKGFTLLELIMVIVIIGVLSTIAVPIYSKHSAKAKVAQAVATIKAELNKAIAEVASTELTTTYNSNFLGSNDNLRLKINLDSMITKAKFSKDIYVKFVQKTTDSKGYIQVYYNGNDSYSDYVYINDDNVLCSGGSTIADAKIYTAGANGLLS